MEPNIKIIQGLLNDVNTNASLQAKKAITNFSVLYGQKLVKTLMNVRTPGKKITSEDIKLAYEASKKQRSVQMQTQLQQKRRQAISKINNAQLISQDELTHQKMAKTAVDIRINDGYIFHINLQKQMQLVYDYNRH